MYDIRVYVVKPSCQRPVQLLRSDTGELILSMRFTLENIQEQAYLTRQIVSQFSGEVWVMLIKQRTHANAWRMIKNRTHLQPTGRAKMRELLERELVSVAGGVQHTEYYNGGGHLKDEDSPSVKTSQHFAGQEGNEHPAGPERTV
jgi:hypothetical protein